MQDEPKPVLKWHYPASGVKTDIGNLFQKFEEDFHSSGGLNAYATFAKQWQNYEFFKGRLTDVYIQKKRKMFIF